ncbi:hypothetical protein PILCRDRAFT_305306 [Piloderma croceum F 1598]|uniref:Uncharacterized protein n=1 Tax=Piloderma croceum (strain F 1598) TaxID=765440 RepID=A0A0C3BLB5_PILCF|nr:hypothetical protein PILCRDRAFT_305306 [Piloderma croceum F 1598]
MLPRYMQTSLVSFIFDRSPCYPQFQQETMASLIRYYKEKSRKTLDRLRSELEEKKALKKENEDLRHQNRQLQQHIDPREPSDAMNANGKRPMAASYRAGTNSSPRSIVTPLGPNRLTIPPGQDAPNFSQQQGPDDSHNAANTNNFQAQMQRPGSSRFVEQYAYNPPQTSQFQAPQLSHTQAAPVRQYQARQAQQRTMMPPPPPPESSRTVRVQGGGSGFKPSASGRSLHPPNLQSNALSSRASPERSDQNQPVARERRQMGPPPTPQASIQAPNRAAFTPVTTQSQAQSQESYPRIQTASFADLQPSKSSARFSGSSSNNRFVPPQAMNGSQRFVAPGLRAPSRTTNGSHTSSGRGGQRMPFVPGAPDGFG